ncbi:MAG: hypothetical protein IPI66_11200 [Chitinophagaceae bacterium]|nr:hypothetical protein [Chitinophagaceae bacterium]
MVPNNQLLPKAKPKEKVTELLPVFKRSKQSLLYKQLHQNADTLLKEAVIVRLIKRNGKYGSGAAQKPSPEPAT